MSVLVNGADVPEATADAPGLSRYSPDRPLVLLTEYPPDHTGGGAVILRGLLGPAERARVVWLTLSNPGGGVADPGGWAGVVPLKSGSAAAGARSLWSDSTVRARALASEVLDVARARNAPALWLVAHGAAVPLAARLVRDGSFPIHLTVHDDPVGQAFMSRRYLPLTPFVARDFAAALRGAASVDTICGAMADAYRRKYGVGSVVVHRGVAGPVAPGADHDRAGGLSVGIIGSIYKYRMLVVLGRAIARAATEAGVPGRVVIVGKGVGDRLRADLDGRVEVEVTGHLPEAEAVERLRRCFALYVNYPFGRRDALFRQTSWPTKVSTYALAARPLLVHMPADGSVAALAAEAPGYARRWGTLREADGAELLGRLWADPDAHRSRHEAAERLRAAVYDPARNRARLFGALDALNGPPGAGG